MTALRAARTFLGLPRAEQRAAVTAAFTLAVVVRALSRGGLAKAEARLAEMPRLLPRNCSVTPKRLAVLVEAVGRRVPRALCLARSLTLARLVRELTTLDAVVRIGVRPGEDTLDAHAWVELGGVVLNDADDVAARFAVIDSRPAP